MLRLVIVGIKPKCLGVMRHGLLGFLLTREDNPEVGVEIGSLRFKSQGFHVMGLCLGELSLAGEVHSQVVVCSGEP